MVEVRETVPRFLNRWGDVNWGTREPQHLVRLRVSVEVFRYPNVLTHHPRAGTMQTRT
jgi:hypothetical protein